MSTATGVPFDQVCAALRIVRPLPEYQFALALGRKWRFDWAWPAQLVALEVDGGVFIRGRHSRGVGAIEDMAKLNEAAIQGWCVLRCVPKALTSAATIVLIRRALYQRRAATSTTPNPNVRVPPFDWVRQSFEGPASKGRE